MKVIDRSSQETERLAGFPARLSQGLKSGSAGSPERAAQERVMASLKKALSNHYILIRNLPLEGLEEPVPFVLVGPPGVRLLYPSPLRGVFRAHHDEWERLDDRQHKYLPVNPNLMRRVLLMARAVEAYFSRQSQQLLQVEPALILTNLGVHVDSVRPAVRIVLVDALDRYIAGLLQSRMVLSQGQVEEAANLLSGNQAQGNEPLPVFVDHDAFSFPEVKPPRQPTELERAVAEKEQALLSRLNKIPFTNRQWVVFGLFMLASIFLLIAFLVYLLASV